MLWPPPQEIRIGDGHCPLPSRLRLTLVPRAALDAGARVFRERAAASGFTILLDDDAGDVRGPYLPTIDVKLASSGARRPLGYTLAIDERGISIRAVEASGAFYGLCTLAQLLRLFREPAPDGARSIPFLAIDDWPDFPHRGVLLDISRTKVPTRETLFEIVDWMGSVKFNQLQLYTEHTFAYRGHESVWKGASPLTGADIDAVDAYARERYIELVPNQQSFGHLHRWLAHDRYRSLAELPEGIVHAFSREKEPYGLCPVDPASLTFLAELYDQLLPHFTSRQFNVGLDETIDLGLGRSKGACEARGSARVYADFLRAVHGLARARGRRMQFFGDILHKYPEIIALVPRDAIVLEWGYDADYDFETHCRPLAESGLEFYVCPGTSSWQSIGGRTENALQNLERAAQAGIAFRASGFLVTDWGDRGHLQPLAVSYVGLTAAAGFAWSASRNAGPPLSTILDHHTFADDTDTCGAFACDLGNAYRVSGVPTTNGSALFFLIAFAAEPLPHTRMPGMDRAGLERTLDFLSARKKALPSTDPSHARAALVAHELRWACDLLSFACRLGLARLERTPPAMVASLPSAARRALADELAPLICEHRRLWTHRYRPGGLSESAAWLERCAALLA